MMSGISSRALAYGEPGNKMKYNGKEEQRQEFADRSGLEWLDYGARMYDNQIARWYVTDPECYKYEGISPYSYALNDPINVVDPDGNLIVFVNGFILGQWMNKNNNKSTPVFENIYFRGGFYPRKVGDAPNPFYKAYPGERTFATGSPTYLGNHFDYWGNENNPKAGVGGLISQAYNDYNTRYISASSYNDSQAGDRFFEGQNAAKDLIKQLDNGAISLGDNETIKIVGHSQGAAFAAGIVSILSKNEKYSKKLEIAIYIAPHQPSDFITPSNVKSMQWSTDLDWIADSKNSWSLMNLLDGGSKNAKINGVDKKDYHLRSSRSNGLGGHYVNTYLNDLANYYRSLDIPVTVIE